jgi:hypothetical protein
MKKIYLFLLLILPSLASIAQCTLTVDYVINGYDVTVTLTGSGATNPIYAIQWGDGAGPTQAASGTHTYTDGVYSLCGVYTNPMDPFNCAEQVCYDITIGNGGGTTCTLNVTPFLAGQTLGLNATGNGAVTPAYTIDWGDGSPLETMAAGAHNYATPGTYTWCVTYTDLDNTANCSLTQCQDVAIVPTTSDCTVALTVTMNGAVATASAVGTGAAMPQYVINWGDGGNPTIGSSGSHTFTANGTFTICATYADTQDFLNCTVSDCEDVVITVSIDEVALRANAIKVIPNPVTEDASIQIILGQPSRLQVEVMDITGRTTYQLLNSERGAGTQVIAWDASALASGIYFVRVKAGDQVRTIKAIKK